MRKLTILIALAITMIVPAVARAATCGPGGNAITCENSKPGLPPSDWQVATDGDPTIQGFATQQSVQPGETIHFKISTNATSYHIAILRIGYYGGDGARLIAQGIRPTVPLPQSQPDCNTDTTTGLVDCGNWTESAFWQVPADAVSGVYAANLIRDDTGGVSQIVFVVRDDTSHSNVLVQTSDATWQAYNNYGGNSLYVCQAFCPPGNPGGYKAAYAVSYNRPDHVTFGPEDLFFYAEFQLVKWLEGNGYDTTYIDEGTVDSNGSLLRNHKVFISSGHDEYWSAGQRTNVTAARDAGVNLAFFSGNEMFWKTRWSQDHRTLICYKETHLIDSPNGTDLRAFDPADPPIWTGTWMDPRLSPPADGGRPQNALTGQLFKVNAGTSTIQVPAAYSKLRLWRDTAASHGPVMLADSTLGYEWDIDADNGFRPAGLFDLSSTTVDNTDSFTDYGTNTASSTQTHHLTEYRASSGALVFGAGTVQWSWGLDHDLTMAQATINLLADMGAQPASLTAGGVLATPSTDRTAPTATIATSSSGSATDVGGVVAGVEVSADGVSWHPAEMNAADRTVTWTYPAGGVRFVRAVDDSGNLG